MRRRCVRDLFALGIWFLVNFLFLYFHDRHTLVSREGKIAAYLLVSFVVVMLGGCRPSQQARRSDASRTGSASATRLTDSLLMAQEKLVTVIDTMSGILITQQSRIRSLEAEVSRLRSMIESQTLSGGMPATGGYYTQPAPAPVRAPSVAPPPPSTESYSAALRLFNDMRYEEALAAFDALTYNEPNSPYAPNFLYWRGESLYALGNYEDALRSFEEALARYPNSGKADDAQFKIGATYEKMNKASSARAAYNTLIAGYPESEYVARARSRIARLR